MDAVEALHHAARQYCAERAALWRQRYAQLGNVGGATVSIAGAKWTYTAAAYDIFPRYQLLSAMQNEVERLVPGDFASLDECRSILALAGETASSPNAKQTNPTAIAAECDEREQFAHFVRTVGQSRLFEQKPLPFRRVLSATEHKAMHATLAGRWGRWYGGYSDQKPANAEAVTLHDAAMEVPESYPRLRAALRGHGVERLFELREHGDGCEIPIESAEFDYNGAEGFWTGSDFGWLVYASHESSITFGSDWLVKKMRAALPDFDRYIYKGWDRAAYS